MISTGSSLGKSNKQGINPGFFYFGSLNKFVSKKYTLNFGEVFTFDQGRVVLKESLKVFKKGKGHVIYQKGFVSQISPR